MKYAFIEQESAQWPVTKLCRVLGVTRSTYYDWYSAKRVPAATTEFAVRLRMKALFEESRGSIGSRRMAEALRAESFDVGRDWATRRMKALDLIVKRKHKFKVTTDSKHTFPIAPNVLNRNFSQAEPNRAWGTDITYLWTQEGWVYLAVVIDLCSRRVVGWAMDRRMKKALVIRALMMAVNLRRPEPGLIHHSDRGSQYASEAYQKLLRQYKMVPSMSRKGNCWDNAPIERFFSSLKREWTGDILYRTRAEAMADVREYVAAYYNSKRLHSTLGYQTPLNFEKNLNKVSGIA